MAKKAEQVVVLEMRLATMVGKLRKEQTIRAMIPAEAIRDNPSLVEIALDGMSKKLTAAIN